MNSGNRTGTGRKAPPESKGAAGRGARLRRCLASQAASWAPGPVSSPALDLLASSPPSSSVVSPSCGLAVLLRLGAAPHPGCRRATAPESDEPYSAIACFSSSTSRALIDSDELAALGVDRVTLASTFSPTAKRSGRCSPRSRDRSALADEAGARRRRPTTSMPPSLHRGDRAGDDVALLQMVAGRGERIVRRAA